MPVWTMQCLNRNCRARFEAWVRDPFCPNCGGKPCKWLPQTVNIGKVAPSIDQTFRTLVDEHNGRVGPTGNRLTDIRCEAGLPAARAPSTSNSVQHSFAGPFGPWAVDLPTTSGGGLVPACVPAPGLRAKQSAPAGAKIGGNPVTEVAGGKNPVTGGPTPVFEARHKGPS